MHATAPVPLDSFIFFRRGKLMNTFYAEKNKATEMILLSVFPVRDFKVTKQSLSSNNCVACMKIE